MEKFKKFWVVSVNGWLVGASYDGRALKELSGPSFKKYKFIRSWDELNYFTPHKESDNKSLVEKWLSQPITHEKETN